MAQQTNLNVSPYFDDFDADTNYHKVLFKPGYPVQARELTGLQSILQNQIDKFGQHFFKEGAKVIPGNTAFTRNYHAIEVNNTHLGFPVDYYIEQLVDRKIVGLKSGVTAIISKILKSSESERGHLTLYISYISTGTVEGNEVKEFQDGELLTADKDIISGPLNNPFIPSGESFASAISTNAASKGSAFSISNGVYFVRGTFVNVEDETIVISQYDNAANCRVGLKVIEEVINSDEDETLNDNSKGFNNYAAPGADRLKIACSLFSKPLDDFNDANFVELAEIRNGELRSQVKNTQYNMVADELARRTYAESGDYTVRPFSITPKESLNDGMGNNGVYEEGQFTYQGTLASEDLAQYAISPGKAFIKGYEIETISTTYLDCPKPRTTKTLEGQSLTYNTGYGIQVNGAYGLPQVGIGNTYILSLRSKRVDSTRRTADGEEIGVARVYDCRLNGGLRDNVNQNVWDISLYDVQTFTKVTLNEPTTLTVPSFVEGKYSGATAFLQAAVSNSTSLTLYETKGEFVENEPFIFDGIENSRVSVAITSFGLSNVKSVYGGPDLGDVGFAKTFNGDVLQEKIWNIGDANISPRDKASGISTITASSEGFPGGLIVEDDLISFSGPPLNDVATGAGNTISVARVTGINTTFITVTGVGTLPGVIESTLPQVGVSTLSVPDLTLIRSRVGGSNKLYTEMPRTLISNVDLDNAAITVRKQFDVKISAAQNQLSATVNAGSNESFPPYTPDRYTLYRADGTIESLSDDMFTFGSAGQTLQISNIGVDLSNDEDATLIASLDKQKPTAKVKRKNRVNTLVINKSKNSGSGVGATTLNDGLSYGNFPYGTRVQDKELSLNYSDIISILGVYESVDTSEPSAPKLTLASLTGPAGKTTDLIVGEKVKGKTSGAIAYYAERVNDTKIAYTPANSSTFTDGEAVVFEESKVEAIISSIDSTSHDVSGNYTFDSGQRSTHYDYGSLLRKSNANEPTKSLKVYFANGYYEASDKGDITTKNSYDNMDYVIDVKSFNGFRNTDIIDIRPKTSNYTVAENSRSPLEFYGRTFNADGNSAANILSGLDDIYVDFSFYLGRIDRIFLTKEGKFQVQYGDPSEKLTEPVIVDDALEIGSAELLPYMLDVRIDTSVEFMNHKRYRMQDIKKLEDRIKNLEYYTNLSLLEANTSNMFIPDENGLNKFKSGFFVDNFTSFLPQENNLVIKNSLDLTGKELRPQHYTNAIDLELGPVENVDATEDKAFVQPEGINIKRSGDVVTLDYTEVEWLKQSFATRTESITPFLVSFWQATLELTPASDTWVDTARIDAKVTQVEGNYAETMANNPTVDPQTGMGPIMWNSWETVWTGREVTEFTRTRVEQSGTTSRGRPIWDGHRGHVGIEAGLLVRPNRHQGRSNERGGEGLLNRRLFPPQGNERNRDRLRGRINQANRLRRRGAFARAGEQFAELATMAREPANEWERLAQAGGFTTRQGPGGARRVRFFVEGVIDRTIEETFRDVLDVGTKSRTGTRTVISEQWDNESHGDRVVNREVIPIMRSRNLHFTAKKCKPLTRFYSFFDGVNVSKYCTPKLLEISMTSGTFQVGEKVVGRMSTERLNNSSEEPQIQFRVAQSNHKEGPYNAPTSFFTNNPYTSQTAASSIESFLGTPGIVQLQGTATSNAIPASYSSTSTILNVDCASLANQPQGDYWGWVETGMTFVGETSGAQATLTGVRLISDLGATLIGSFFIPNPNTARHPRFETGVKTFTLIDNDVNDQDNTESIGEENYTASGTLETVQEQIISVRNARVEQKQETQAEQVRRSTGPQLIESRVIRDQSTARAVREWYDPLAQSYQVLDDTGIFLTSCEVFFQTKDDMNIPMTFQLRTMKGGTPTQKVIPFSEVIVYPDEINVSQKGDVPTKINFKAPVYMEPGQDYAITLASWSTKYRVFISRIGESDLITDEFISQQPYLGSLFKSQNASTWDASQWEDLKFTFYRADFETEGTLEVYNPILSEGNNQIPRLKPNSINITSRKVRVGLGTTMHSNHELSFGNTIYQDTTSATGNYVGNAGVATGSMAVINAGFGYTPASGTHVMVGVALSTITGHGKDATAVVTVTNGTVTGAAVSTSGYGYQVGDVLGITTNLGINAYVSVVSIAATNEIILDNVQGDFATGVGKTIMYTNGVGIGTTMNGFGGNVLPTNIEIVREDNIYHDGLHFTVDHKNHGMYHETNYVTITNVASDIMPTKLSSPYNSDSTASISIDSSTNFTTFENVSVATSNPGYVKIGDEIIKYTGTSGNTLTGITREQDTTVAKNYLTGANVQKYELGGVSLRRFNKTHYMGDVADAAANQSKAPIGYDHYTLKLDMTANVGVSRTTSESFPILYTNNTKSTGGFNIHATQNMPFEIISPMVHNITVNGTNVTGQMRTVTGTALGDGQGVSPMVPFADNGWETITLNKTNYLDSSRCIASRINETSSGVIQQLPGDRSFKMRLKLESNDSRVSPIIDLQRINAILTSNRIDIPIYDYNSDSRAYDLFRDPTACQYVSKENVLENGATSMQVLFSAHSNFFTDIRVFYAISNTTNFNPVFKPFPGYNNIDSTGEVIDWQFCDGTPDIYPHPSDTKGFLSSELEFKQYTYSIKDLPTFNSYRIKIVLLGTSQVWTPRIKELRAICLA